MKNKSILIKFLIVVVLISLIMVKANTCDLTVFFVEYYGRSPIASAKTPQRNSLGNNDYAPVISKLNQPRRSSGQNPHTGTDFYMPKHMDVYPLFPGYVVENQQDAYPPD